MAGENLRPLPRVESFIVELADLLSLFLKEDFAISTTPNLKLCKQVLQPNGPGE
jgi:hypothetical protein